MSSRYQIEVLVKKSYKFTANDLPDANRKTREAKQHLKKKYDDVVVLSVCRK